MCDFDPDELIKFTTTAFKVAEMTFTCLFVYNIQSKFTHNTNIWH